MQDSKRSERRPNREEKAAGRQPAESVDAVEGVDRKSATVTASPAPAIEGICFLTRQLKKVSNFKA